MHSTKAVSLLFLLMILLGGCKYFQPTLQEQLDSGKTIAEAYNEGLTLDELYGLTYQGGLVMYFDPASNSGLLAAPTDQSADAKWGCRGDQMEGADAAALGEGQQNTDDILDGCPDLGIAARICDELVLTDKDDWFLPSKDELVLIKARLFDNGFGELSGIYWSSTESSDNNAWTQDIGVGTQLDFSKNTVHHVRAVRVFQD